VTRVKTQSPTWRQRGRSLLRELNDERTVVLALTQERDALRLRVAALLNDLEAARHELAVRSVASPAAPQAEATPIPAVEDPSLGEVTA
jgi:hypothetical protein